MKGISTLVGGREKRGKEEIEVQKKKNNLIN